MSTSGSGTAVSDDEEGRAFLQERITLLARVQCLLLLVATAVSTLAYLVYPERIPLRAGALGGEIAFAFVALSVTWWLLRSRPLPRRWLEVTDVQLAIGGGAVVAVGTLLSLQQVEQMAVAFMFVACVVLARAILVPSTWTRTLYVAIGTLLPITTANCIVAARYVADLRVPLPMFIVGGIAMCIPVIVVAALGSGVIFGLRRQIRRAQRLGQYTLGEKIGEGGMGAV
jgi:hypothetical protein